MKRQPRDPRHPGGLLLHQDGQWKLRLLLDAVDGPGRVYPQGFLTPGTARTAARWLWGPGEWVDTGRTEGVVSIYRLT